MTKERYKSLDFEEEMDMLLETRDCALKKVHALVKGDGKLKGLLALHQIYERTCINIEELKDRNSDTRAKNEIVVRFERIPELERDDEKRDNEIPRKT